MALRNFKDGGKRLAGFVLGQCIGLAAALPIMITPAKAGESIWTHNGSTIRYLSAGQERWMYYLAPRPGLLAIGVTPDTLLFHGWRVGYRLVGTAYVFSSNCPATPYHVEGRIYSETDVTLEGALPVVDPYTCAVLGYTWENYNSALRFRYVMTTSRAPIIARE